MYRASSAALNAFRYPLAGLRFGRKEGRQSYFYSIEALPRLHLTCYCWSMVFQLLATLRDFALFLQKRAVLSKEQAGIGRLGYAEELLANKAFLFINIRV